MRNLIFLLVLANVLYFLWDRFVSDPEETGVAIVDESELGPPLAIAKNQVAEAATSVGAVLGSGQPSDLAAVVGRSCVSIFFKTNSEADSAIAALEREGMLTSLRSTQGQVFVGNWVQIRNIPDLKSGAGMIDKLQSGGISDAYLMDDENGRYKISLGLFGDMGRAEKIELQAKSLGLPADITPRMRDATVYYVDIGLPPGKGAGAIIEQFGEERVFLREKATCPRKN
jgi:hypothetical protein